MVRAAIRGSGWRATPLQHMLWAAPHLKMPLQAEMPLQGNSRR
jgi:hypothetical protein